jgi:hypothetical protein
MSLTTRWTEQDGSDQRWRNRRKQRRSGWHSSSPKRGGQGALVHQTWLGKRQNGEGITGLLTYDIKRLSGQWWWLTAVGRLLQARVTTVARYGWPPAPRGWRGALQLGPRPSLASNCGERRQINVQKEELLAARVWSLWMKSGQYSRL